MTNATAKYVIQADDRTKAAIAQVKANFTSMERHAKATISAMNVALGAFAGFSTMQLFRKSIEATARANKPFADALAQVKDAAENLLVPKQGLPGVTDALRELKETLEDPATVQAADTFFSALVKGAAGAARALATVTGAVSDVAAIGFGDTEDEKLRASIRRQRALLTDDLLPSRRASLEAAIARNETALARLPTAGGAVAMFDELADARRNFRPDPIEIPSFRRQRTSEDIRAAKEAAELARSNRIFSDWRETVLPELRKQGEEMATAYEAGFGTIDLSDEAARQLVVVREALTEPMSVYAEQAARNMQDAFANFLFDPFKGGVRGMLASFTDAMRRMVAEAASAKILEATGITGFVTGAIGALFGGARASGGPVDAGRTYLVGERGPELVTMGGNGYVTPNSKLAGGPSIVINNAIDARGATTDLVQQLPRILEQNNRQIYANLARALPGARF